MFASYYPNAVLSWLNYGAVIVATIVYGVVFGKFLRARRTAPA